MNARFSTKSKSAGVAQFGFANGAKPSSNLDDVSFLRLPEVKAVTGLSKTSLYMLIREQSFPAPVRLGPRAVAWVRSEVKQWATNRVLASRSAASAQAANRLPHSVRPESRAAAKRLA